MMKLNYAYFISTQNPALAVLKPASSRLVDCEYELTKTCRIEGYETGLLDIFYLSLIQLVTYNHTELSVNQRKIFI